MKTFFASLLLGLLSLGPDAVSSPHLLLENAKTDREKGALVGPVRTVRIEMARGSRDSSGKWVEGPPELVALTTYNGKGNKTEHFRNETISNVPLSRDIPSENKKRLSALAWGKWTYTYDQEGKRVSRTRTRADGTLHDRTLYAYDESGNKIEKVTYRADGSVGEKLVHSYNAEGQRIETASFTASRNIIKNRRTVYTYNRQGNLAQAVTSDELGLISKETFVYDPPGRLTEEVLYYPDGSSVKVRSIHTYDAEGNRTSTGVYEAHDPGSVAVLYDRKGNVIENLTYAADGSITRKIVFIYKFDPAGNWIRRSALHCVSKAPSGEFTCELSGEMTYRTITYEAEASLVSRGSFEVN